MCVSRDSTADEKSKNDTGVRIGLLVARRKKYSRQRMMNCSEDIVKSEPPPASAKIQPDLSNPGSVISPVAGRRVDFFQNNTDQKLHHWPIRLHNSISRSNRVSLQSNISMKIEQELSSAKLDWTNWNQTDTILDRKVYNRIHANLWAWRSTALSSLNSKPQGAAAGL